MSTTKAPRRFRARTPLLLGAAACAACCALPIAAVVIGAGAATTAALILEPLAAALVAIGVVMATVAYVRRRRAAAAASCATTGACAVDQSCGCGPTMEDRAVSVGCTLPREDMPERGEEFRRLFERGLTSREADGARVVWTFAWTPELESDARALAKAEQGCCSFWSFDFRRLGGELRWEAKVPPDRIEAIAMLDGIAAAAMTSSTRA